MGDQSVAELNQGARQEHGARVAAALEKALSGQLTPPGTPAKGGKPAAVPKGSLAAQSAAGAAPSAAPVPARAAPAVAEAVSPPAAGAAPDELEVPQEAAEEELPAEEAPAIAPELEELQELGKKRDLRAMEKLLGLEEGYLGVNNASWKAYRKRVDEVAARETQLASNDAKLVSTYGGAVQLVQAAQKGDLRAYAQLIQHTVGVSIDQFIGHYAKNIPAISDRERQLETENRQLRAGGTQDAQGTPATAESAAVKADAYITAEAGSHPAMKLSGAKEGVRKIWLGSFDKSSNAFKLTPKAAAQQFLTERQAAFEREQWILAGKKPPSKPTTKAIARTGASESQPRKQNLTREQLIEQGAENMRRAKRAAAASGR